MKKDNLSWLKLFSLLVLLPLFLWITTLHSTASQYRELQKLRRERVSAPAFEDYSHAYYRNNLLQGDYLFKGYLDMAIAEGCEIVSFTPSCDKNEGELSLFRCHILLKGRFIPLLKLVHSLEDNPDIGFAKLRFFHKSEQDAFVSLEVELIQLVLNG